MMKKFALILLFCALFATPFVLGRSKGPLPPTTESVDDCPDSLRALWLYTEGIKRLSIDRDSTAARNLLSEAVRIDSTFAPAWFTLAAHDLTESPTEAAEMARRACEADTTNLWYERCYGQTLLQCRRYDVALAQYRRLIRKDPNDPDNYRVVAAIYQQLNNPYMALATLDSAELRFGRLSGLGRLKRHLLIATNQRERALEEAKVLVEEAPYDPENHTELASLYGMMKQDSLALAEFHTALAIDPENVQALVALHDYYDEKQDYLQSFIIQQRIFSSNEVPLSVKLRQIDAYTADRRFYGKHYPQIGSLISILAIRYPREKEVIDHYAEHLIAGGELDQALALYKSHLDDEPPVAEYYDMVIEIERYQKHTDSVSLYLNRAIRRFPDRSHFYLVRGALHIGTADPKAALGDFQNALRYAESDSERSDIWASMGDAWFQVAEESQKQGDAKAHKKSCKESGRAYEQGLKYNKDNALILNNYAYHLALEKERLEEALMMAERAVFLSDNNPTYLDTQAWVLYQMGRYEEARKLMKQAIALDQNPNYDYYLHYGDILHALGERFLAETYWRKALEKGCAAEEIEKRMKH